MYTNGKWRFKKINKNKADESTIGATHNKTLDRNPSVAFVGTAAENILDWLESFNRIAIHNVWNDQKPLQVIPVYLKDAALNFYRSLPDQTKTYVNLLKDALRDRYHTQGRLYDMRVKLHELRQGSSLEMYINDLDTLARHLELPEQ